MRVIIQRVLNASVSIGGKVHSSIGRGMLILVGVEDGDDVEQVQWIAGKTARLRIFNDGQGVMNLSVIEAGGEALAVSQFTLTASTCKGNRPSYIRAAAPEAAEALYKEFCRTLSQLIGRPVMQGVFRADMQVSLTNDGPVTIMIDSRLKE